MKIIKQSLLILFIGVFALIILGLIFQEYLLFIPSRDLQLSQHISKTYNVKTVTLHNKKGNKLTGKFYFNGTSENEKAPLIIYFPGNAETASRAFLGNYQSGLLEKLHGYNFLAINYPKFEDSEGKLSIDNLLEESELFYDWAVLQDYVDENNINVIGYSIGTGMATYLSSTRNVKSLVLLAPYDNLLNVYNQNVPIFYGPVRKLAKYGISSNEYAMLSKANPLIIASKSDIVIKYKFSENLSKVFPKLYKFITLENVRHEHIWQEKIVVDEIAKYYKAIK